MGAVKSLQFTVQANSFAQAKADMEIALAKHIESLLDGTGRASTGQAA